MGGNKMCDLSSTDMSVCEEVSRDTEQAFDNFD